MRRLICSPRQQNVIDLVEFLVARGQVAADLATRFRATLSVEAQRGQVDIGMGLCGRGASRLADSMARISCPECQALLQPGLYRYGVAG